MAGPESSVYVSYALDRSALGSPDLDPGDEHGVVIRRRGFSPWLLLTLVGLGLEAMAVAPAVGITAPALPFISDIQGIPILQSLVWHILAAISAGLAFPGWKKGPAIDEAQVSIGPMALVLALCFPLLGSFTVVALAIRMPMSDWRPIRTLDDYRKLVDEILEQTRVVEDVRPEMVTRSYRALEMAPFHRVLAMHPDSGSIDSIFRSAMLLDRSVTCRLLRESLRSPVALTRYYASVALARIEEDMDRNLLKCERALEKDPENPNLAVNLGDARLDYADMDSAEDAVVKFHLEEAIRLYTVNLPLVERERAQLVRIRLARALYLLGRPADALVHYTALIEDGAQEATVFYGAMEAGLAAGELATLGRHMRAMIQRQPDSALAQRVARYWRLKEQPSGIYGRPARSRV
jgi:hypothetical protein